jgi:1,4-dihydroxy-2-naphthoyl-CoA hydrolase
LKFSCFFNGNQELNSLIEMNPLKPPSTLEEWNAFGQDFLQGYLGIEVISVSADELKARMKVTRQICAPNGFLHAASVVALADSACGNATVNNLPVGADGFTTLELKTNFIGTTLEGYVSCVATCAHKGRTTQVWDAEVVAEESGRTIALFRCTQIILWPKK